MRFIIDNSKRWITGAVLLGVVIAVGIMDNYTLIWAFLGLFYFIGFKEAMNLYKIESRKLYYYASILWIVAYFYPNPTELFFIVAIILSAETAYRKGDIRYIFPFLYPVSGFLFILMLYREYGVEWLYWLLVVVAMSDIGAYIIGRSIGKRKFSPTSPNKTVEGVLGGLLFATIFGSYLAYSWDLASLWAAIAISFISSVASIFGDLFESYLKREAGVKDSGTLLPGHGGVLDRVDGYLFGSIIMFTALRVI